MSYDQRVNGEPLECMVTHDDEVEAGGCNQRINLIAVILGRADHCQSFRQCAINPLIHPENSLLVMH